MDNKVLVVEVSYENGKSSFQIFDSNVEIFIHGAMGVSEATEYLSEEIGQVMNEVKAGDMFER